MSNLVEELLGPGADVYTKELNKIVYPLKNNSKANCDKLLYVYCSHYKKIYNKDVIEIDKIINKDPNGDLFDPTFVIPSDFKKNLKEFLIKSQIQSPQPENHFILWDDLIKMCDVFKININSPNSSAGGASSHPSTDICMREIEIAPLYMSSNPDTAIKKIAPLMTAMRNEALKYKETFSKCHKEDKIIIGFVDLSQSPAGNFFGALPHKNAFIIDNINKFNIQFEPKSTVAFDAWREPIDMTVLTKYFEDKVDGTVHYPSSFQTIKIRGDQDTLKWIGGGQDNVYCVIYSLYFTLLFIKNYRNLVEIMSPDYVNNFDNDVYSVKATGNQASFQPHHTTGGKSKRKLKRSKITKRKLKRSKRKLKRTKNKSSKMSDSEMRSFYS